METMSLIGALGLEVPVEECGWSTLMAIWATGLWNIMGGEGWRRALGYPGGWTLCMKFPSEAKY